jgi:hypothetical protein
MRRQDHEQREREKLEDLSRRERDMARVMSATALKMLTIAQKVMAVNLDDNAALLKICPPGKVGNFARTAAFIGRTALEAEQDALGVDELVKRLTMDE